MLLPTSNDQSECKSFPMFPCFTSGDSRNSQQPMIQALHVIFHRHHNTLAEKLGKLKTNWNDETIFQVSYIFRGKYVFRRREELCLLSSLIFYITSSFQKLLVKEGY